VTDQRPAPGIMVFAGLGLLNAVCALSGLFLGWVADRAFRTLPLLMLVGLVAGITLGVIATRREWKRYS
jgi:F0F1-type ATP synthase assembly protein I